MDLLNMLACAGGVMDARLLPAERGGSTPTSALALRFTEILPKRFAALNKLWHRTHKRIGAINTLKPCYAASHQGEIYAVAAWSNPVARRLPQRTWLELRRFAIAPDAPKYTATRMLGWMTRDLRRRLPHLERVISYQNADEHTGTIYRAAGWIPEVAPKGGAWSNRQRWNRTATRLDNKVRWYKSLK